MEPTGAYETRRILARKATAAAWLNEVVCKARMWTPAPPRVKFLHGGGDTCALVGQGRASRRWPTDTAQFALTYPASPLPFSALPMTRGGGGGGKLVGIGGECCYRDPRAGRRERDSVVPDAREVIVVDIGTGVRRALLGRRDSKSGTET
jgi:hypothetical protein